MSELVEQKLGQYTVLEQIGQGGMARVFKGYQNSLARYVAIKAISVQEDGGRDNDFVQHFTTEARLVARLTHPNIVPVHDYGEDDGWAFIVMEYISDGTVRDRIVRAEEQNSRLDLALTLDLMAQAALALDFAHLNGIVHRDVKPANMLLRTEDHLLLSDFGIATILEANKAFTRSGANAGTPQYMAPEQGIPNAVIDGRTDIYALGVVLFQCVTGRLPFVADTPMAVIMKHIYESVPRPSAFVPGIPRGIEQIILRAMAKDPNARYQRARDMAEHLRQAEADVRRGAMGARVVPLGEEPSARPNGHMPVSLAPRSVPGGPGTCFRCGASNQSQNRFCTTCGYDLSGARAKADRYLLPSGRPLRSRILMQNGPLAGSGFVLHQDTTTLGRTAGNDIVIPDGTVSRYHARLIFHNGQWALEDLNSSNGSWVNGRRISQPTPLMHGDQVRLGDEVLIFELMR